MSSALLAFLIAVKPFFFGGEEPVGRATLVVETSQVKEHGAGPAIARRVTLAGTALLRAANVIEGGGPNDPVVRVMVRPLRGSALGYASTISLHQSGRRVSVTRERCSLCTEGELVAGVERSLARLAPSVRDLVRG
jgi:hypothetical protein